MSDFLQSLVLRAAGLPPVTTPSPRVAPAAEPLESDALPEESLEEVAPVAAAPRQEDRALVPPPRADRVVEPAAAPPAPAGEPPVIHELFEIAEEAGEMPPLLPQQRVAPRDDSAPAPTVIEREILRETIVPPPVETHETPMTLAQPPVAPLVVPRETIVERQTETAAEPLDAQPAEAAAPVVLQPIVVEQTRTVVEPLREERTVVETRVEPAEAPPAVREEPPAPANERAPRAMLRPREERPTAPQREERDIPIALAPPASEDDEPAGTAAEPAPPHTLVLPQPPAPPAQQTADDASQPIDIHIGTIEIRGPASPPPPAPAPPSVTITRAPEPPSNFDAYTSLRNYHFPDVW